MRRGENSGRWVRGKLAAAAHLNGEDRFHALEEVVLFDEAEVRRRAGKGLLGLVRPPHPAADDDVESLERDAVGLHDDDGADVVDVQVHPVIPW